MAASSNVNSSRSPVSPDSEVPSSILIVGAGVFGLSTALALSNNPRYANTKLTLIDRSPVPVPDGSSVDTSRIIRADYSDRAYASLAASAQSRWRGAWGDDGRYTESGLVLTGESSSSSAPPPYVRKSHANVCSLSASPETDIQLLPSPAAIAAASATGGAPHGSWGYLNRRSGWADAEASIRYAHSLLLATQRVTILTDTVSRLLFSAPPASPAVTGAVLATTDERITADLTILATGAWTPTLVDLRGRVTATGQILAYTAVSPAEEASWGSIPVTLNLSTGLFVTPARKGVLKVARHAYGYVNPQTIAYPEPGPPSASTTFRISVPATHHPIPTAASSLLHAFQTSLFPSLSTRPFTYTRLCWYADTPTGDFLIDRHPRYAGLLLATGGSGHGFKFLPVIGEKVVEVLEGRVGDELGGRWRWREREGEREGEDGWGTEDGSRSGERGVVLESALRQGVQERGKL